MKVINYDQQVNEREKEDAELTRSEIHRDEMSKLD